MPPRPAQTIARRRSLAVLEVVAVSDIDADAAMIILSIFSASATLSPTSSMMRSRVSG